MSANNKIIKILVGFSLLIAITNPLKAQTYNKEFKKAEKAFLESRYKDAADFYSNAALTIKSPNKSHLELFYKLGYCEMRIGEYRKAMTSYAKYLSISKRFKVNIKELKQVKEWNEWCGIELTEPMNTRKPKGFNDLIEIKSLSTLNSPLNDFGAILIENNTRFILSSNRPTAEDKDLYAINNDIYVAKYTNGVISNPLKIRAEFNSKAEDFSSSFCKATQTLYYTYSKDMNEKADIYSCKKINDNWAEPVKLPVSINTSAWEGFPSISQDGKSLYFSSTRENGSGGADLYFSVLQADGSWSTAKSLGPVVNTKYDEISPHIDSTGSKLYFSSNGHLGAGGFDIYYTEFEASSFWSEPTHLPPPINGETDDICYTTTEIPGVALFSSKRRGGSGIYDIYMIEPKKDKEIEKKEDFFVDAADQKTEKKEVKTETKVPEETKTDVPKAEKVAKVTKDVEKATTSPTKPAKTTSGSDETASAVSEISEYQLFNASIEGLYFKVQIGAYRNHITKYHQVFTSKLDPQKITEEQWPPDFLYKYTIGKQFTITSATNYKLEIRSLGYKDAFLTCYYNSNRIPMSEAKEVIRKYYRLN
ncbi:MAG: PD40 domain-containing protein [Bacteroidetes bacterium]|nr:PD40 domain-containing protein [Bacteroidota bacterium]